MGEIDTHGISRHINLLPISIADPAFMLCLHASVGNDELVENFARLSGLNPFNPNRQFAAAFVRFVHECVYTRLDEKALDDLRCQNVNS